MTDIRNRLVFIDRLRQTHPYTVAELEAHAALARLAERWKKRNTAERVTNSLKRPRRRPFI